MKEQAQKKMRRYTDAELSLIKNTFSGEDIGILKALRKYFLELPVSKEETAQIDAFSGDVKAVLRKTFLPTIDGDAPLHQVIDLWMTVNLEGKQPEEITMLLTARSIVIEYMDKKLGFDDAEKKSFKRLGFQAGATDFDNATNMIARNTIIGLVEQCLTQLNVLANEKEETPAEALARLKKDSAE